METRNHDAARYIDHEPFKAYALELRREAIDEFWFGLSAKVASIFAKWRHGAAAHAHA